MADYELELRGSSQPEPIGSTGISFAAPGLVGRLSVDERAARVGGTAVRGGLRDSAQLTSADAIDNAIDEIGDLASYNLETEASTPEVRRAEGVRAGAGELADDEATLDYEPKPDEYSYVVYRDENGAISIHYPESLTAAALAPEKTAETVRSAHANTQHYRLQLRRPVPTAPVASAEEQTRFGAVTIGKKLLKLVVGKIIKKAAGPLVGAADYGAVWLWEKKARAFEGFHGGADPTTLLADDPVALTASDWAKLDGADKKTLLFIHGTISSTSGAFGGLLNFPPAATADPLYKQYDGRVVGFNHHTLTKSVLENVCDFYAGLPASGTYNFDIVCHSRGGLIARALKELTPAQISTATNRNCATSCEFRIGKIIFAGTPNVGTPLADPKDIPHALEILANVASLFPGAGLALAGVLSGAAFVAENGFQALPGMRNMNPTDRFIKDLNQPAGAASPSPLADYYAIQSNFSLKGIVNQVLLKGLKYLFDQELNDVIVPTLGVSNIDGTTLPGNVTRYYGEPPKVQSVAHTQYFQQAETWNQIVTWLS